MYQNMTATFNFGNGTSDRVICHIHSVLIEGFTQTYRTTKVVLEFRSAVHAEHALADWMSEWDMPEFTPTQDGESLIQEFTDGRWYQPTCSIMSALTFKWRDVTGIYMTTVE